MSKSKEYYDNPLGCRAEVREMNHKTLEDVEELIHKFMPKITDECYKGVEDGFKHYGIDCKLGMEELETELEKLKL